MFTSPGYAVEAIKISLDQDLVENFSLDPTYNYTLRRSVDGGCGAQFDWLDARTGGTRLYLQDEDFGTVALPAGRTFSFYGNIYDAIHVGSNGIITFGVGSKTFSVPIPIETPNNGVYAFFTDLNPSGGWQG